MHLLMVRCVLAMELWISVQPGLHAPRQVFCGGKFTQRLHLLSAVGQQQPSVLDDHVSRECFTQREDKENEGGKKCPRWFGACLNFQQLTCVCKRVLFDCSRRVLVVACSHWSERGGTDAGESDIQVRTSRGHELHAKWEFGMRDFSYLVLVKLWFTHKARQLELVTFRTTRKRRYVICI